ncbi:MAG TPA: hypothetical protein ENK33_01705, partial [Desulfobacterales bacterium]|nr:hypothetical protein [Desulfobacterales bacterium]
MNINSLLAGLSVPAAGRPAGHARVNTPSRPFSSDAGRDSFTRSSPSSSISFPPLYTRAAAAGGLPRSAGRGADSSQAAGAAQQADPDAADKAAAPEQGGRAKGPQDTSKAPGGPRKPNGAPLSSSEKLLIAQLQKVDQEVHNHELAHLAAAGGYARSGASYQYQTGPDGRKYAVGGEVQIDTSPGRT